MYGMEGQNHLVPTEYGCLLQILEYVVKRNIYVTHMAALTIHVIDIKKKTFMTTLFN